MLTFAGDERKAAANLKKHGVSFDEARTVFFDEHARLIAEPRQFGRRRPVRHPWSVRANKAARCLPLLPGERLVHKDHHSAQGDTPGSARLREFYNMRKEYDFSESKPNPYARKLKRQVTIRIDEDALEYFKSLATEMGMPYQGLINSYLRECARTHKRPSVKWA